MQLIAVLGSFTAGEMARSAMSTIWMTPNSTSCCSVRIGPMSNAPVSSTARSVDPRAPVDHQQGHAGWHEVADLSGDAQAQLVRPCELHEPPCMDEADVAGDLVQDRELLLGR